MANAFKDAAGRVTKQMTPEELARANQAKAAGSTAVPAYFAASKPSGIAVGGGGGSSGGLLAGKVLVRDKEQGNVARIANPTTTPQAKPYFSPAAPQEPQEPAKLGGSSWGLDRAIDRVSQPQAPASQPTPTEPVPQVQPQQPENPVVTQQPKPSAPPPAVSPTPAPQAPTPVPAAPTTPGSGQMANQLWEEAMKAMKAPSRYDADLVKQGAQVIEDTIARMRGTGTRNIGEWAASRGLVGSSLEGERMTDLEGQLQAQAREGLFNLGREQATTFGQDRQSAFGMGLGTAGLSEGIAGRIGNENYRDRALAQDRYFGEQDVGLRSRGYDQSQLSLIGNLVDRFGPEVLEQLGIQA